MAKVEFDAWHNYILQRREEVSEKPEFQIEPKTRALLHEQFDRLKKRESQKLPAAKVTAMHGAFTEKFKFKVPLHPRNLAHLVWPYQGYLGGFSEREYSFNELETIYQNQIIASLEKTTGRTMLGDELSAFTFYSIVCDPEKGFLDWTEMHELLGGLRFDYVESADDFRSEFAFTTKQRPGELKAPHDSQVYRFDLVRSIFLDRGL